MTRAEYHRYLRSWPWKRCRARALLRDGLRCQDCGGELDLEAHHLSYARVGREDPGDLLTLCRDCHRRRHGLEIEVGVKVGSTGAG